MKRFLIALSLCLFNGAFAQKQVDHLLNSKIFGHERKVSIYLPKAYIEDSLSKFPVAYLFDGQFEPYLTMVSGIMEYYSQTNNGVPMLIVSVHTEDRYEEFIPEPKTDSTNKTSYSTKLTDFLNQELFAFVNTNYRTSDFKLGIGHSLGGTFLLNEAFRINSAFGGIIAASPNTTLNEMSKMIPEYLDESPAMTTFLYVTAGDNDEMENYFLKTTLQIDSAITSRKSESPDWNFRKYEQANHMETFPRTFNDGYLLFSQKWNITANDITGFKGLQDTLLEQEIQKCFQRKSVIRKLEMVYSFRTVLSVQGVAEETQDYCVAFDISTLSLKLLETDSTISKEYKEDLLPKLNEKRNFYKFNEICTIANSASERKDYEVAAQEYLRAFEMNFFRGTFYQRINSLTAFAQTGNTEAAFKQIDLLANRFGLKGSRALTENPLLAPLHHDKRWKKYLKILEENEKSN